MSARRAWTTTRPTSSTSSSMTTCWSMAKWAMRSPGTYRPRLPSTTCSTASTRPTASGRAARAQAAPITCTPRPAATCRPRSPSATDVPGNNAAPALALRPRSAAVRRGGMIVTGALAGWLAAAALAADTRPAGITVRDDQGREVILSHPARRAITITPHATELVYAAGAGRYLAGTAQGSDHPPGARTLPSIGDAMRPSLESAAALRPDLLIAWQPTHPDPLGDLMRRLGVPVYYSDPRTLSAIPDAVQAM